MKLKPEAIQDLRDQGPTNREVADQLGKIIADFIAENASWFPRAEDGVKYKGVDSEEIAEEKEFGWFKIG